MSHNDPKKTTMTQNFSTMSHNEMTQKLGTMSHNDPETWHNGSETPQCVTMRQKIIKMMSHYYSKKYHNVLQ